MKSFLIKLLLTAFSALALAYVIKGITFNTPLDAFWFAFVMAFLNSTLKPVLRFFTLPLTIFSLGFFLLVINGLLVLIADTLIEGMHVQGLLSAMVFSVALSLLTLVLNVFFNPTSSSSKQP
jgi:putative membrane protein